MKTWEYNTIRICYDKKKHKDWVVEPLGQAAIAGLQAILESFGAQGWELVSLNLEESQASVGFGTWHIDPVSYRATFKLPSGERS